MTLAGKTIVVTGATQGIGLSCTLELARRGSRLILGARSADKLSEVARVAEDLGGEVFTHTLDLRDEQSIAAFAKDVQEYAPPDILVNNAGTGVFAPFAELDVNAVRSMVETNLTGTILLTQALLPCLIRQPGGLIVMVSSRLSTDSVPSRSVYSATKAALRSLAQTLRKEYSNRGLRVSEFRPAAVATGFAGSEDRDWFLDPDYVAKALAFVCEQPPEVSIDEILVRSTGQEP